MNIKKNSVLLLNSYYEPITLISLKKVFNLQTRDKIYIEEYEDNLKIRSFNKEWKVPCVVRLNSYVNIRKKKRDTSNKRTKIYRRDNYKCGYCNVLGNDKTLTLDHIIPKSLNGSNEQDNLVTCCFDCNQKKGNKTLQESGMKLLHTPKQLSLELDKLTLNNWAKQKPIWRKYLYLTDDANGDSKYHHIEN